MCLTPHQQTEQADDKPAVLAIEYKKNSDVKEERVQSPPPPEPEPEPVKVEAPASVPPPDLLVTYLMN